MVFAGRIENGVVVFREPVPLPNGTAVRVEATELQPADFWESCSLDELVRCQGVGAPEATDDVQGGWPTDELDDGFENVVRLGRE